MSLFPGSLASFLGFTSGHTLSADQHAAQHNSEQAEIIAAQTKVGTGASTPTSGLVLRGNGAGTSAWAQVNLSSDITGSLPVANAALVLAAVYPVGCIYTEITGVNPNITFGFGTWAAFGTGQTLVGIDTNQTEFNTVQKTGGEKTHTLLTAEMASHNHGSVSLIGQIVMHNQAISTNVASMSGIFSPTGSNANYAVPATSGAATSYGVINIDASHTHTTNGSDTAHNNLQPYITVYFWRRTA